MLPVSRSPTKRDAALKGAPKRETKVVSTRSACIQCTFYIAQFKSHSTESLLEYFRRVTGHQCSQGLWDLHRECKLAHSCHAVPVKLMVGVKQRLK